MARYVCSVCGYVHDDEAAGMTWERLPDGWTCPVCGAAKSQFQPVGVDSAPGRDPTANPAALPRPAVLVHRVFGYVFLAIYLVLLVQMVPRLWAYQIEFPARTVLHIALGMTIGTVLLLKIGIVRYFRRLDQPLVPALGTTLLVGSVVLIGFSIPSAFQEALATGRLFSTENVQRVRELLAQTGLDAAECTRLASPDALRSGQRVLRRECIECHDLRTVLAKPRTPDGWRQTVRRMADRTTMLNPLEEEDQWLVTAYLVAISPQLRQSAQQLRDQQDRRAKSRQAAEAIVAHDAGGVVYDAAAAEQLFQSKCSQCHAADDVRNAPPGSEDEARELVAWMVDEGLEATEDELSQIVQYLTETYATPEE